MAFINNNEAFSLHSSFIYFHYIFHSNITAVKFQVCSTEVINLL